MIRIKNFTKNIGKKNILTNINFSIDTGKICGLIGRNGAGKTSLLKCIMGLWKIENGEIEINKKNIINDFNFKEYTAFIPDEVNIPKGYSVKEAEIFFSLGFKRFDKIYFNKLLNLYKINKKEKIGDLSKGFKLKLQMALNLARRPDLIILDEPLANLDPISRIELINILIECAIEKKITVLLSTHNIIDVQKFCDDFIIMDKGTIIEQGSVEYFKDKIKMLNIIFKENMYINFDDFENIIEINKLGKSVNIVVNNFEISIINKLKELGAESVEELNLDIEEILVYMLGGKNFEKIL